MRPARLVRLTLLLVLAIIGPESSASDESARDSQPPRSPLRVDRMVADAGDLLLGERAEYQFRLTNTSTAPLPLEVHATCGCTVARHEDKIAPGATSVVTAELNTSGMPLGALHKTLLVSIPGSDARPLQLTLQARLQSVVELLDVDRTPVVLHEDEPTTREVRLRLRGDETLRITGATCNLPQATATVHSITSTKDSGRLFKLRVTIDAGAPKGRTPLSVQLATTSLAEKSVFVNFTLEKGILASPSAVVFKLDVRQPRQTPTVAIHLVRRDGTFRVTGVDSPDFLLKMETETVREGREYRVRLTYVGRKHPESRPSSGVVRIMTDDPDQPSLELRSRVVMTDESARIPDKK